MKMDQIAQQMRSLAAAMEKLSVAGPPQRRRRPKRGKTAGSPAVLAGPSKRKSRSKKRSGLGPARMDGVGAGDIRITKTELVATVSTTTTATSSGSIEIRSQSSAFPWLKNLSDSFERSKWLALRVEYIPGCSLTEAGRFAMGVDWDWSSVQTTRQKIAGYQPNAASSVFKGVSMTVPRKENKWYADAAADLVNKGPCKIVWAVEGSPSKTYGELWVTYTVLLSGPRS